MSALLPHKSLCFVGKDFHYHIFAFQIELLLGFKLFSFLQTKERIEALFFAQQTRFLVIQVVDHFPLLNLTNIACLSKNGFPAKSVTWRERVDVNLPLPLQTRGLKITINQPLLCPVRIQFRCDMLNKIRLVNFCKTIDCWNVKPTTASSIKVSAPIFKR